MLALILFSYYFICLIPFCFQKLDQIVSDQLHLFCEPLYG